MTPPAAPAYSLTQRLLAREARDDDTPAARAAAAERVLRRVYDSLARWVGADGCEELLVRAVARAQAEHPGLRAVGLPSRLAMPAAAIQAASHPHASDGADEAAEGLVVTLAALIDLLGRLIGEDMVISLVEQSVPRTSGDTAAPGGQGAS